jgi:hypothetical protein
VAHTCYRLYADNVDERFVDPDTHDFIGPDSHVRQYNHPRTAQSFSRMATSTGLLFRHRRVSTNLLAAKTTITHYGDLAWYGDNAVPGFIPSWWDLATEVRDPRPHYSLVFVNTNPVPQTYDLIAELGPRIFGVVSRFLRNK